MALAQRKSEGSQHAVATMAARVRHARRMKGLPLGEQHILGETSQVEELLRRDFAGTHGAAAAAVGQEALAMLENATQEEQHAFVATAQAAAKAAARLA